jgi:hypothetical protein
MWKRLQLFGNSLNSDTFLIRLIAKCRKVLAVSIDKNTPKQQPYFVITQMT